LTNFTTGSSLFRQKRENRIIETATSMVVSKIPTARSHPDSNTTTPLNAMKIMYIKPIRSNHWTIHRPTEKSVHELITSAAQTTRNK
jgi:hypothetical protein